jgi:hypothetical protein
LRTIQRSDAGETGDMDRRGGLPDHSGVNRRF